MTDSAKIIIRSVLAEDKNLIMATWLKGNYYGNPYFWNVPQDIYFKEYAKIITAILFTPGVEALIACDESNPSFVLGFSVFKDDAIHWVYVKRDYRMAGIAKMLLGHREFKTIKSITRQGRFLAEKHGLVFNPF